MAKLPLRRTCREVTRLVLESQDRPLAPFDAAALRLHWLACDGCRRFRDQQKLVRQALDRWKRDAGGPDSDNDGDGPGA